jgi:hypothetical protein
MKINSAVVIKRLNGSSVLTDQEPVIVNGQPLMVNGAPQLAGGHEMTVGDVVSTILSTKKTDRFSTLKAYVLAQRFYKAGVIDIDESDYSALREVIEGNDQFVPFVLAQVLQVLIDAKDKSERKPAK